MTGAFLARVGVRQHELDPFGRLHPSVYLRYLAHAAVEASAAAGFDAAWYAAAGTLWLVRRSTFTVHRPATADEALAIRTWVEDFRRVRSHRRYEIVGPEGGLRLEARTDWVYVDARSGRPRRVSPEMERAFGAGHAPGAEREPWRAPPPPAAPARAVHRVRLHELDSLGHVNNAVYLDLLVQAALDALEEAGWSLDRVVAGGAVPILWRADVEHREAARYGERIETLTWFAATPDGLDVHQRTVRADDGRPLVQATTRWRWADPASGATVEPPEGLLPALRPILAA